MQKMESRITVYFENPFWVCAYERISDARLEVCKITFGAEPKDYEVYRYLLENWHLLRFSPPVKAGKLQTAKINPKRLQKKINQQLKPQGIGTKSQQALKEQHEEAKASRKVISREQKEAEEKKQFEWRQRKKKQKHRGH